MEILEVVRDLTAQTVERMILSGPRKKGQEEVSGEKIYRKAQIRPVSIKGEVMYQVERFTEKQAFHQNIYPEELPGVLTEELSENFMQLDSWSREYVSFVKISKKGKVLYRKKPTLEEGEVNEAPAPLEVIAPVKKQNREKKYLLEAEKKYDSLLELGIVTKEGKIVNQMYDKYRQINHFVELIDQGIEPGVKELNIIDFGCGKSYLTFVLYEYLTKVRGIRAHVIGLDLKADVIKKCNEIAKKHGYEDLEFRVGDINGYQPEFKVDMVISLHACDTATDFALFNAITWGTPRIFSVPCCQHEINHQVNKKTMGSLSEYGLIKERISALMTDAIRCDLLTWQGYKVDVLEFVDMQHSPKNILIRAVKTGNVHASEKAGRDALARCREAKETYHIDPTLMKLLEEA